MTRVIWITALATGLAVGLVAGSALADGPAAEDTVVLTGEGGMLDNGALSEVSGGTLLGDPVEPGAWRAADGYPMEFPASLSAAGSPVAGAAITGADLGHSPPAGDAIGGAAGTAGDVANTIF
jgi:hypothetical protein